jgi:hypothetical protein
MTAVSPSPSIDNGALTPVRAQLILVLLCCMRLHSLASLDNNNLKSYLNFTY